MKTTTQARPGKILFLLFNIVALILFYTPLSSLYFFAIESALYSYIVLIPIVSAYLIFTSRKEIFAFCRPSFTSGGLIAAAGIILYIYLRIQEGSINEEDYLSYVTFSFLLFWAGGFTLFYGTRAFKAALFPILFLLLMIPIPSMALEGIVSFLQHTSADLSYFMLSHTSMPIYREGLVFHLPNISVEVAKECSGIRSSIGLFITCSLIGHLFLKRNSSKLVLILFVIPLTIFKNAIRISTLSLLAVYVDTSFITNSLLHKKGGIVFFLMALAILVPIIWLLRRYEKWAEKGTKR